MSQMLKYEDCGLKNIWLANGFRYEDLEGVGRCLEIDDIDGLHRAIGHRLVNYKKRLTGAEIRFLRVEMGMSQKRLADCLGVDEQTVSLWERSKRRPAIAAERMLRLLYLEHVWTALPKLLNLSRSGMTPIAKRRKGATFSRTQSTAGGWQHDGNA
jgi:putative transcriptional regulator